MGKAALEEEPFCRLESRPSREVELLEAVSLIDQEMPVHRQRLFRTGKEKPPCKQSSYGRAIILPSMTRSVLH